MFEIKVHVEIPALDRLIGSLGAGTLSVQPVMSAAPSAAPTGAPASIPAPKPSQAVDPATAAVTPSPNTPVAVAPTASVSATAYTLAELSKAATDHLMPQRANDLINLLTTFGVTSLVDLPEDRYGEFATALRGMGAKI